MNYRIAASSETLMHQASMTAHEYLHEAKKSIDHCFGEGYAQKHPELVSAFIQTCALDFQAAVITGALEEIGGALEEGLSHIARAVEDEDLSVYSSP